MKYAQWVSKPINLLITLLLAIFTIEMLAMFLVFILMENIKVSHQLAAFLDASMLTLISAPLIWLLIMRPISQHLKRVNNELQNSLIASQVNAEVMKTTGIGILITNAESKILSINPGFTRLTGMSIEDVLGKTPSILNSGRHDKDFYKKMWQTIQQKGNWHGEVYNKRRNGDIYLESLSITQVKNEQGQVTNYIGVFQDITADRAYREKLIDKARFDILTKIYNREAFIDHLEKLLARARREQSSVMVLFIDLDKFKPINDNYGHETGDELLKHTANTLKNSFRETDLISRFGGDEFVLAIPLKDKHPKHETTLIPIEKIMGALAKKTSINQHELSIQVSIGVSIAPHDSTNIDELIRMADKAMYTAKQQDKNSYFFWHHFKKK